MNSIFFLPLILIVLFFLSRALIKNLYLFFYRLTKSQEKAVNFLTWLVLPGTIIHELSHLLAAELLRVRTGRLFFKPEVKNDGRIRAGGLEIAKTGPFRQALIGLAPILMGTAIITSLAYFYLLPLVDFFPTPFHLQGFPPPLLAGDSSASEAFLLPLLFYLIFVISNTMFSSKKDLETILFPLLIILLGLTVYWLGGFKISFSPELISQISQLFKALNFSLLGAVVVDLGFLGLIKIFNRR